MRSHQPVPKRIQNAPELSLGLELYFLGFMDLSNSRQIGFGSGPIPWGAIQEYCLYNDLDVEQVEDMHYHISHLDTVWRDFYAQKEGDT